MENISAKNLSFTKKVTIGAHVDQIWALESLSRVFIADLWSFEFCGENAVFRQFPLLF